MLIPTIWRMVLGFLAAAIISDSGTAQMMVTFDVLANNFSPPPLYGLMFEDINSGDGGLYAEMLQNRAFQQVTPNTPGALYAWSAINEAVISVIIDPSPVSSALPYSLQLVIPEGSSGQVGFQNEGYYGINVNSEWTYNASFYYKFPVASSFNGVATVSLQGIEGQEVYASASVPIDGLQTEWKQMAVSLIPTSSPAGRDNTFVITLDGVAAAGQTVNFAMLSLFPPTYKDRPNGLRIDLATSLHEMKPSFLRFPGGNSLGESLATRWIWNNTIGPLIDRPGRMGAWEYINTDGLGLLEYLIMCEDLGIEPIMAVWAGFTLDGESVPEDGLAPYIQTAIDQINFVIGDPATNQYAALRANFGHPEPFTLNYVEIGNEDFLTSESYTYRWRDFSAALSAAFPQIRFIATTIPFNPILDPIPIYYDNHLYQTPDYFVENAFYYDAYERNGTSYYQGEYAAISTDLGGILNVTGPGRLLYPTVQSAISEAVYLTGLERNGDIIFAASYAALLINDVGNYNWRPNLIAFDGSEVYPSTSYYVQQIFSTHRGTYCLDSTLPTKGGMLHWSATIDSDLHAIYLKIVNYDTAPAMMTFVLPFAVGECGQAIVLTGPPNASNNPTTPNAVVPITSNMTFAQTFNYTAPAYSVSALTAFYGERDGDVPICGYPR